MFVSSPIVASPRYVRCDGFHAVGQIRLLDLDEVADAHVVAEHRAAAQVRERPDRDAVADDDVEHDAFAYASSLSPSTRVREARVRADGAALADLRKTRRSRCSDRSPYRGRSAVPAPDTSSPDRRSLRRRACAARRAARSFRARASASSTRSLTPSSCAVSSHGTGRTRLPALTKCATVSVR